MYWPSRSHPNPKAELPQLSPLKANKLKAENLLSPYR